ncbi:MAG: disulfide bond formation protein B [Legionella sp.]|nr:disulfide bond formation protein B [Legionella sp.]
MTKSTYKMIQLLLSLVTLFVLLSSLYYQYIEKMNPCPLCLMQRLCVILLLFIFFMGLITYKRIKLLSILQILMSCAGLYFSIRHLWLQSLPIGEAPACMPGLDTLIRYFPWQTVAHALFWGASDCAEETSKILGMTMPAWATLYFFGMLVVGFILLFLQSSTKHQNNSLRKHQ